MLVEIIDKRMSFSYSPCSKTYNLQNEYRRTVSFGAVSMPDLVLNKNKIEALDC